MGADACPPTSSFRRSSLEPVIGAPAPPSSSSSSSPHPLTLLSWNVLADGLAQSGRWAHCPPEALEWGARQPGLLAEIDASGADVLCLQECNHWDWWKGQLDARGYAGAFWPKPGSPAGRAGSPPDGCVVAWRKERFTATTVEGRPFDARCVVVGGLVGPARALPLPDSTTDEEASPNGGGDCRSPPIITASGEALPAPTPPRGVQGSLVVTLNDSHSGRVVVVGCTHLKAKAGEEEDVVRGRQAAEAAARVLRAGGEGNAVVILAGDFNAGPGTAAVSAPVACGLTSIWDIGSPWPWTTFKFRTAGVGLGAASNNTLPGELKVSKGLVDHVFFRGCALTARWPALAEPEQGLPVDGYPSDHVAVCVRWDV